MTTLKVQLCAICSDSMVNKISNWSFYCVKCNYWSSDLPVDIVNEHDEVFSLTSDNLKPIGFLDAVRIENFDLILDHINKLSNNKSSKILDVGCATGLFIEMANARGHDVWGIEPNPKMASISKSKGLKVKSGYFPDAILGEGEFDFIVFNDVFEHIPDLSLILNGVSGKLKRGGVLVINLPNSDGFLFSLGKYLYKFNLETLWDRLWQKMFHTPHLHFFNSSSLDKFLLSFGFYVRKKPINLSVFSTSGLWGRVSADKNSYFLKNIVIFCAIVVIRPVLLFFPKDSIVNFYSQK